MDRRPVRLERIGNGFCFPLASGPRNPSHRRCFQQWQTFAEPEFPDLSEIAIPIQVDFHQ